MRTGHKYRIALAIAAILLALSGASARAQESLTPPEQKWAELIALAEAYQTGYLQVVAICCSQLYASTGIVATDFANGYIDAETALSALDANSLLQSCCYTTLEEITSLTPQDDVVLHTEAGKLMAIIQAEGDLLGALRDVCVDPSDANVARTEASRQEVERLLNEYTASEAEAGINSIP